MRGSPSLWYVADGEYTHQTVFAFSACWPVWLCARSPGSQEVETGARGMQCASMVQPHLPMQKSEPTFVRLIRFTGVGRSFPARAKASLRPGAVPLGIPDEAGGAGAAIVTLPVPGSRSGTHTTSAPWTLTHKQAAAHRPAPSGAYRHPTGCRHPPEPSPTQARCTQRRVRWLSALMTSQGCGSL